MIHLDTHVVIWLYQGDVKRLSLQAQNLIEDNDVVISPMVMLEMEYLYEIKRIKSDANAILDVLHAAIGLELEQADFIKIVEKALPIKWTRDTFDRLITAAASVKQNVLLTKDKNIQENYPFAVWD